MQVRDAIVSLFGLKTGKHLATLGAGTRDRGGIFKIDARGHGEIVMGEDDRHVDFRVSVLRSPGRAGASQLTVATVVQCPNLLGHSYLLLIAPFHRAVVKAGLRLAARIGWPRA